MIAPENTAFIEDLYRQYCAGGDVPQEWAEYFKDWNGQPQAPVYTSERLFRSGGGAGNGADLLLQEKVDQLIRAYRVRGHRIAKLDPLGRHRESFEELELEHYGLGDEHLSQSFSAESLGLGTASLRDILDLLQSTYCGYIGVQYMHIDDPAPKFWLQEHMESSRNQRTLSSDEKHRILTRLTDAQIFEEFLAKKYVGSKRFGLEGGESLIPLLDMALDMAGESGVTDVVMGMAHRGRLNVMANIMDKSPALLFREFDDVDPERMWGKGDVKYHLGCTNTWTTTQGKEIDLTLCFNPSHLEFVGPVALGRVRSRQDRLSSQFSSVMGVVIHGDAAFSGQGVVAELLNMSEIPGYRVGGTLHIVLNNQIGFTTLPGQSRSSHYATDVAKMLQIPVIHVNGEHPEAVAQAIWLAMHYRKEFHKDVVIDMYCYRKRGHNEGDDPTFTQPVMYRTIKKLRSVREVYLDNLVESGGITREEGERIAEARTGVLQQELDKAREPDFVYEAHEPKNTEVWQSYEGGNDDSVAEVDTSIRKELFGSLLTKACEVPETFTVHPKLKRIVLDSRLDMASLKKPVDWGGGETLAYASLLHQGFPVRLSGQDVGRGTFSHRHAILHDYENGDYYIPLQNIDKEQGRFQVWDSPLTETAVMGFEFGFSLDTPKSLTVWEAQFGDFVNVAQVIIDQFITTAEDKWDMLTGLVLLLPHGFEGQGPEHSSARLERFLQLAAEDNIQVFNLSTPAQLFHCLRRQVIRKLRKPAVIMSPKSLLRHPRCVSKMEDFTEGGFQKIIPEAVVDPKKVRRVLLCCGKLYYELLEYKEEQDRQDIALVRVEQLYPLSEEYLLESLEHYPEAEEVVWVQEEPENMGALVYFSYHFRDLLEKKWRYSTVSRASSASPATGSSTSHKIEQADLIERAFAPLSQPVAQHTRR